MAAFTFTVLLGTLFPLVAEAVRGVKVSVGEPFFNRMTVPIMAALLFLVGVGPVLPWGRPHRERLTRRLLYPGAGGIAAFILALVVGTRDVWAVLAFAFAGFALVGNLSEYAVGVQARTKAHGENVLRALTGLVNANRRRYGGYLAHIGVVAMAVGITASSTFRYEREATLAPGESLQVAEYTVRLADLWAREEPQRFAVGVTMEVLKDGGVIDTLEPRLNFYPTSDQPITTPAVRSNAAEDLYLTLMAFEQDGSSATVRGIVEPLVAWIWIGGALVGLGALLSLTGRQRRRSGAAERRAETAARPRRPTKPLGPGSRE